MCGGYRRSCVAKFGQLKTKTRIIVLRDLRAPNFGVKLSRPGAGPAAELPTSSPASRRHGGCSSPLGSPNVMRGNHRAASASARGTGRAAYTVIRWADRSSARERVGRRSSFVLGVLHGSGGRGRTLTRN